MVIMSPYKGLKILELGRGQGARPGYHLYLCSDDNGDIIPTVLHESMEHLIDGVKVK